MSEGLTVACMSVYRADHARVEGADNVLDDDRCLRILTHRGSLQRHFEGAGLTGAVAW